MGGKRLIFEWILKGDLIGDGFDGRGRLREKEEFRKILRILV